MTHSSVAEMWQAYSAEHGVQRPTPDSWHFCDNQADANLCAALALSGEKRATSPSLWWYESQALTPPKPGDLNIVTDWSGVAVCIIRITDVRVVDFDDVDAEHAKAEGEGDGSLDHWRRVHWDYYQHELAGTGRAPTPDMPVVCEYFEVVYPTRESPTRGSSAGDV